MTTNSFSVKKGDNNRVFLGNEDVWAHAFLYLGLKDIPQCALACKTFAKIIADDHGSVPWKGAEREMTGTSATMTRKASFSNASNHCFLWKKAMQYAELCEKSSNPQPPDEGEMGADLAYDIFHIRAAGRNNVPMEVEPSTSSESPGAATFYIMTDEEVEEHKRAAKQRHAELMEEAKNPPPPKDYDYEIFVRIVRTTDEEVLGQGFVHPEQITPYMSPLNQQLMVLLMNEPGIIDVTDSTEFSNFLDSGPSRGETEGSRFHFEGGSEFVNSIKATIVAIHKCDQVTRLIRSTGGYGNRQETGHSRIYV